MRDITIEMDKQERNDKYSNDNIYYTQDNKHNHKAQESYDGQICNDMNFKDNLKHGEYENNEIDFRNKYGKVELDLSVPNSLNDNIGISNSRGINSCFMKSPDFFKRVNNYDESQNITQSRNVDNHDPNYLEEHVIFDQKINEARFSRNRSLQNASLSQKISPGFFYQNDLYNQYSGENCNIDGFYHQQIQDNYSVHQDINSQSNNLFGQPFMNFNKKRSYSEADLNKSIRTSPFLNFRRTSQFNDEFHTKTNRPISEHCIDPRMFYKNMSTTQLSNKENHPKPAFSYAQIIKRALNGSHDGKLTLGEIYKWIEDNFEYYKYANPVWKNSIRHNLSLSKCFKKVPREPGTRGKGGKWMIDKEFIAQEENRKKRKSFEEENMMNHHSYGLDPEDPRFYQM